MHQNVITDDAQKQYNTASDHQEATYIIQNDENYVTLTFSYVTFVW
jgi:hypothetical protein